MGLTGRFNLRKTFSGRIVLQVEEEKKSFWSFFAEQPKLRRRWRDATMMDLAAVELRPLVDVRHRPYNPLSYVATRTPPQPAREPVRIPTKPSTSSNLKPSWHSDFKPSMVPR